ncbi:hypothetical protein [Rhodohalobacter sp.]|uniref:hypothetical protein n=1 Tax=Rhodohalobacter sp. TaxID=1974210 RepID=UPI002ACD9F8A|nr:hypothetical protein [Rhodohalobacter sp.]MDZ7755148.1 hypothetical protein [Rhodohalobacter sp.]
MRLAKLHHCLRSVTEAGTYTVNADAGVAGLVVFTATAEPGAADSFVISTISTPQTAGQPFSITIEAQDEFENRATGYSGSPGLSTTAGAITPSHNDL